MIECKEEDDGSLTFTWDKNDPIESILNTWTEEDFIRAIEIEINNKKRVTILMAKDQTEVGITGLPIPKKKRSPKKQYEFEKKRRENLGTNVGGHQYQKDVTPGYNPRQRTFEEFMGLCEAKVPVTRQAGDFRYSGRTGEEKAERRAKVLANSPDAKKRRQANTIRSKIKTVADRDTARASSEAMRKLYKGQQKRANELAHERMRASQS